MWKNNGKMVRINISAINVRLWEWDGIELYWEMGGFRAG